METQTAAPNRALKIIERMIVAAATVTLAALFLNAKGFAQSLCVEASPRLKADWPQTDFSLCTVSLLEILSGGVPKDGIPAINDPLFESVSNVSDLTPKEPIISLTLNGETKAWPLRILTWHEIVNDHLGGVPIAVTYCPLCNAAIIFERTVDGRVLDFGTTGNLRHSDLVMYDRQTESWWQQYTGEALFGEYTGHTLSMLPARLENWQSFKERHPEALVLVPQNTNLRAYGTNPYVGYDSTDFPFLYRGEVPDGIAPMERVVVVDDHAISLPLLQKLKQLKIGQFRITWSPDQNSALDTRLISAGRDVGNVVVQKQTNDSFVDYPHHVTFAFVFHAFNPDEEIRVK